ncbi:unnamed protein product [Vitrella brassicaformis CCMP3155]|uniref:Uncharacterized protein n=1 Tax=Vitrella brassicaformis (strain CCMP3155) TaxID=1169540 RepID=A0A0G4ERY5_VITBC|nr:unnamed protein product [Vitrella brassicaformis CCMP3155]|eukprot:CEL99998.1 unnamed protein product [Vitrella brassicaformis CCMP3155]
MQPSTCLPCPLSPECGITRLSPSGGDIMEPSCGEESDDTRFPQQQTMDALGDHRENDTDSEQDKGAAGECVQTTAEPAHGRIPPYRSMLSTSTAHTTTAIAIDDYSKECYASEADREGAPDGIHHREEKAIAASVAEFRESAGYEANFEEFPTVLEYKTVRGPDGSTREVVVGTHFNPEPLWSTMQRIGKMMLRQLAAALCVSAVVISTLLMYWFSCESRIMGAAVDVIRRLEGPPIWSSLLVVLTAVPYLLTPRLIQGKMVSLSSKLLYSVAIAFFDLITDILLPYGIVLYLGVRRFLKSGRCTRDAAVFMETRQDTVTSNR